MATLKLVRTYQKKVTTGVLYMGTKELCKTIELAWLLNEKGKSCIPKGTYKMVWTFSPSFRRNTWRLVDVPNRDGILIHAANFTRQLKGCIAPCLSHADLDKDGVMDGANSAKAMDLVEAALRKFQATGCTIEVV